MQYGPGNVRMSRQVAERLLAGRLALEQQAHAEPRPALRADLAVLRASGQMVNLDVTPDFTAAVPVISGQTGPFTGSFPKALMNADTNNIAPRIGFAWRIKPGDDPARRLRHQLQLRVVRGRSRGSSSGQPPFAVDRQHHRHVPGAPLTLADPFADVAANDTTNNYGVDKNYALGRVADVERRFLERPPAGLERRRRLHRHARLEPRHRARAEPRSGRPADSGRRSRSSGRRPKARRSSMRRRSAPRVGRSKGSAAASPTRSPNRATTRRSIGGGGTTVAQDDQNLAAEWGLSSFDRRHQLVGQREHRAAVRPQSQVAQRSPAFGSRCSATGAFTTTFTLQSGTPYTPRVTAAVSDVARGTNGTLRADYNGAADFGLATRPSIGSSTRGVHDSAGRHVRHRVAQHDHRPGQQAAERAVRARRPHERQPRAHASR